MRRPVLALAAAVLAGVVTALPAAAQLTQSTTVSANPVDYTPHVLDGEVRAFALVGETVVVGGAFGTVADASGSTRYQRRNVFAYEQRTGRVLDFAPAVDGPVYALAAGANGTVYLGGAFQHVAGAAQRGIAQLRLADASRVPTFTASVNWGDVRGLAANGPWLYAGGSFSAIGGAKRVGLARLSAATGGVDPAFDLRLAAPNLTRVKIEALAVRPDGARLVAVGALEQAAGQYRAQVVMVDTAATPARLADWYTDAYTRPCRRGFETYLRGVDFSPAGDYLVIVSTGRRSGDRLMCDTAARYETGGTGLHRPTWVNYTGGDSLYSVAVTGSTVYVGGHQRWMDNPFGHESAGPGAVSRVGIAALNPVNGKATLWNPTRQRGVGARALLATPVGLLVGSDTEQLGREYHGRLGMFPLG
jgi:hypothetical protein